MRSFSLINAPLSPSPSHNVAGVAVGSKHGEPVLDVYVAHKFRDEQIPSEERLPDHVDGYGIRVVESGFFLPLTTVSGFPPGTSMRPMEPGISVGPISVMTAGTLGAIVTDGSEHYVLSNNHVLAGVNTVPIGTQILQPGLFDGGGTQDVVAKLSRFVPLASGRDVRVDGAIAAIDPWIPWTNRSGSGLEIRGVGQPQIGMQVEKIGRTTGHTTGTITGLAFGGTVPHVDPTGRLVEVDFVDQVTIVTNDQKPFSSSGDSGSVVLETETGLAVALVAAGSGPYTMANQISLVLSELGSLHFA